MQDPIERLQADVTVDQAAIHLVVAMLSREAERLKHDGRDTHCELLLRAVALMYERWLEQTPMMVPPEEPS